MPRSRPFVPCLDFSPLCRSPGKNRRIYITPSNLISIAPLAEVCDPRVTALGPAAASPQMDLRVWWAIMRWEQDDLPKRLLRRRRIRHRALSHRARHGFGGSLVSALQFIGEATGENGDFPAVPVFQSRRRYSGLRNAPGHGPCVSVHLWGARKKRNPNVWRRRRLLMPPNVG